jgi:hypothetical protein
MTLLAGSNSYSAPRRVPLKSVDVKVARKLQHQRRAVWGYRQLMPLSHRYVMEMNLTGSYPDQLLRICTTI